MKAMLLERVEAIWRLEDGRLTDVAGPLQPVAAGGRPPW
jgi:hypothetical protein